ncbi:DUF4013 domain-containing protein [Adlercreutzia agrestimuris]|uniref:DUF4013 domain-containing protein n=1 Tax=Adlercreutzia agrestimuris TaxID=2941324 RepID=UPI00203B38CD|nr:hypothetical protein [Adlercreutzia agrestimuris]
MSDFNDNKSGQRQQSDPQKPLDHTQQEQDSSVPVSGEQPVVPVPPTDAENNEPNPPSQWQNQIPPQWPTGPQNQNGPQAPHVYYAPTNDPHGQYSPNKRAPQKILDPEQYELRRARNYILIANICGPVSLFVGGMLLAIIGLVFAILGFRKLSSLIKSNSSVSQIAKIIIRTAQISIVICAVAFILNAVTAYIMFPQILNMVQSGDYASLNAPSGNMPSGTSSTWG